MAEIVFFGHDARDAAVQRRIASFQYAGARVLGFTMHRGGPVNASWKNVDLGETRDAAFAQRLAALIRARPIILAYADKIRSADVLYARNLDMLALARWAQKASGSRAKLVYECLDIHRFMTRADALGWAMRALERDLLAYTDLAVVSSPAFVREYFDRFQPGRARTLLVENRLPYGFEYGPRMSSTRPGEGAIRVGWFGNLRCKRSFALLLMLAERFPERIAISLRGAPARTELADFEARASSFPNVEFGGRYAWPNDLASIYADVDVVWAGDFHDPGANSKWLLPNRLYEGGYYAAPPVAPIDSETGRWVEAQGFGFTLLEPLESTLPAFFETLDHARIAAARDRMLAADLSTFVQPGSEVERLIQAACGS